MLKRLMLAVVGIAMGGLVGLIAAFLGAGSPAILIGGIVGGLVFFFGIPVLLGGPDQ